MLQLQSDSPSDPVDFPGDPILYFYDSNRILEERDCDAVQMAARPVCFKSNSDDMLPVPSVRGILRVLVSNADDINVYHVFDIEQFLAFVCVGGGNICVEFCVGVFAVRFEFSAVVVEEDGGQSIFQRFEDA